MEQKPKKAKQPLPAGASQGTHTHTTARMVRGNAELARIANAWVGRAGGPIKTRARWKPGPREVTSWAPESYIAGLPKVT